MRGANRSAPDDLPKPVMNGRVLVRARERAHHAAMKKSKSVGRWITGVSAAALASTVMGTAVGEEANTPMTLQSETFVNGHTLPLSMINTMPNANGQNTCTASGDPGGNESPQLTWGNVPAGTRSFAVVAYDGVAQFTHWAIYNIPAGTTELPANAGKVGSNKYGTQNGNDFFTPGYGGPCPPAAYEPHLHIYTFTVYALDTYLRVVPTFGAFVPAGPEGLYQELLTASRAGHVLGSATITGYYAAVGPDSD
jgi:Raf kinase inhibitor-like YbhB/YbcL family protein